MTTSLTWEQHCKIIDERLARQKQEKEQKQPPKQEGIITLSEPKPATMAYLTKEIVALKSQVKSLVGQVQLLRQELTAKK
jgi:hypothetical protein